MVTTLRFLLVLVLLAGVHPRAANAQTSGKLDVGGHFGVLRLSEFNLIDAGVGVDVAWQAAPVFALEGALTWFPGGGSGADGLRVERQDRILGLFGVRTGVRRRQVELFGRARAGFLKFNQLDDAVCIALSVFPLPLECQLLTGYTAFATDIGGGVSFVPSDRLRLRVDVGDLIVRYGQESFRPNGERTSGFTSHNLLFSAGAAVRF